MKSLQAAASLPGRVLLSAIFIHAGFGKLMAPAQTKALMASVGHLPMVPLLYVLTVIVELGGGLLILFGWKTRWAAAVLFLFLIPVTLTFHTQWATPQQQMMQETQIFKNLAIMGGLLMMVAFGAGAISIDGQTRATGKTAVPEDTIQSSA